MLRRWRRSFHTPRLGWIHKLCHASFPDSNVSNDQRKFHENLFTHYFRFDLNNRTTLTLLTHYSSAIFSFRFTTTFFFFLSFRCLLYNKIPSKWKIVKIFFFCLLAKIYKQDDDGGGNEKKTEKAAKAAAVEKERDLFNLIFGRSSSFALIRRVFVVGSGELELELEGNTNNFRRHSTLWP